MRLMASRFVSLLALLCLVVPASWAGGEIVERTAGQGAPTTYEVCRASVAGIGGGRLPVVKKGTTYFSGVMAQVQINGADLGSAFSAFVAEKYAAQVAGVECASAPDQTSARKIIDATWKDAAGTSSTYTDYVETGWTYTSAAIAAPPPAPASPGESITYDCDGGPGKRGFTVAATYFKQIKAIVTIDGATTELKWDSSDASGSSYGAAGIGISRFQGGAHLFRGAKASNCVEHTATPPAAAPSSQSTTVAVTHAVAATPAAGAVAQSAATPKTVYIICRADTSPGEPHFYNPPVDGTGGEYATWQPAFQNYLVEKQHFRGSGVGCGYYPTQAAAQVDFDQWVANARHDSTIPGLTFKVIVTDWKFK